MVVFKKTIKVMLLWTCFVPYTVAIGQPAAPYSLSAYCDSAQHHFPSIMQKTALADAAQAGVRDAKHAFLPSGLAVDELNLGTDNSLPGSYFSLGLIPSTSNGIRADNNYQSATGNIAIFQSQYELFNFGLKKATIKNAGAFANLSMADLTKEIYLLKWDVGKLYFQMLKNQFQLGIDRQNVERYEAIYKIIVAITRSGIKPGADSSLALAELSRSRISFNQTAGQILQLQQQMSFLTGIPPEKVAVDTVETRNYFPALSSLSAGNFPDTSNNPITDFYVKQKLLHLQTEQLVSKSYLPKIYLIGSGWARGSSIDYTGEYKALSEGLGYQRFNYMLGAGFVYDIFNGIRRRDKLAISRFNTAASEYDLEQQKSSLQNLNNQADAAIRTATKNLMEIPIQINAAQEAYNQKLAQYRAGIINLVDLTNASFVLYRSQSDYVQTLSDWLLSNLDKAVSTGSVDLFIQSIKK